LKTHEEKEKERLNNREFCKSSGRISSINRGREKRINESTEFDTQCNQEKMEEGHLCLILIHVLTHRKIPVCAVEICCESCVGASRKYPEEFAPRDNFVCTSGN